MTKPVLFLKAHVDAFTRKDGVTVAAHETKVQAHIPDDENPKYALSGLSSHALGHAARGSIDLKNHAHDELANRGLDSDGKWIGFKEAAAHHAPLKKPSADEGVVPDKKATREVSDHMQGVHTSILSGAAHGKVDLAHQAKDQLAGRGHDSNGAWVGFDNAKKHHFSDASEKPKPQSKPKEKPKAKPALDPHPNVIGKATDGDKHSFKFGGKEYHHTGKEGNSMHDQTLVKEAESEDGHRVWRDDTDRVHADSQEEAKKARSGK